jgi:hypothetical protein
VEQASCLFSLWNRHLACLVCGTGILPVWFVEQASCLFGLWNRHLACLVCGTGILPVLASSLDRQEKVNYKQQT